MNSLMSRIDALSLFVGEHMLDVVAVTETWLTSDVESSFVALEGYDIVRGDTNGHVRKHGACLFVRNRLRFEEVVLRYLNVAAMHILDLDGWVLALCRPPSYGDAQNNSLINLMSDFCIGREVVVLGDFNLPTLTWSSDRVIDAYVRPLDRLFLDCFVSLGLTQWDTYSEDCCSIPTMLALSCYSRVFVFGKFVSEGIGE